MAQKTIKTEKKCHKCKVVKPMEMFYQNKNRSDGHNSACSDCAKTIAAQWRVDNLEKSIANGKKWRKEHPERMASSSRKQKLKFKYGMTPDDYTNMAQQQGQCCAICGNHMDLFPKGLVVDHINHDSLDNRKENLRICTIAQNNMNRPGPQKNCKSGVRGVIWEKRWKRWQATIRVNRKQIYLGIFKELEAAKSAYAQANKKYLGEYGGRI